MLRVCLCPVEYTMASEKTSDRVMPSSEHLPQVWMLAVLPNLPGFYNAATHTSTFPPLFDQLYSYAWFVGITIAFVLYALLHLGEKQHAATPTL